MVNVHGELGMYWPQLAKDVACHQEEYRNQKVQNMRYWG